MLRLVALTSRPAYKSFSVPRNSGKKFSSSVRDPYKILGVAQTADFLEIKKKYFKLVKEHHPDKNQGDSENDKIFRRIQDSYEMIKEDRGMKPRMGFRVS